MSVIDMKINDPDEFTDQKHLMIFTKGCNMSCDYCFNKHLIEGPAFFFKKSMVNDIIVSNKESVKYILFTGGKPTVSFELYDYIKLAKDNGYFVEVCTNGTLPDRIEDIMFYVDKFRVDIKAGYEYRHMFYTDDQWQGLDRTIRVLKDHEDVEYRTTLHEHVTPEYLHDVLETAWLSGVKNYALIHDVNHTVTFDYHPLVSRYFPEYKEYRVKEMAGV